MCNALNLVQRWRKDPACIGNIKRPVSGCGLGHVTQFRNFGTPLITYERKELSASNFVQTEDGACLCRDHKTTPKWAWPGSRDLIFKFWDPLITLERIEQSASNLVQTWRTDPAYIGSAQCCLSERFFHSKLCWITLQVSHHRGWRIVSKMEGKTNNLRLLRAVRNQYCWLLGNHWRGV